ncbi:MAG: cytochrome c, partial [Gemmatimonadales bacterium]
MSVKRLLGLASTLVLVPSALTAQYPVRDGTVASMDPYVFAAADFGIDARSVTFSKDIAPILQRSCQNCHRAGGGAPMALTTYQEARRWATRIKERTAIRDRMGAMPPFYVEPGIGIQDFKNDPSLSDHELALIQAWVDNGAPEGNPADLPPPIEWPDGRSWTLGEPDLIVRGPDITMPAVGPDRWGDIGTVPTGLTEDRYVMSVEVREINDIPEDAEATTVGGRYIFHHMTYTSGVLTEDGTSLVDGTTQGWPIHEVGRNPDIFPEGV